MVYKKSTAFLSKQHFLDLKKQSEHSGLCLDTSSHVVFEVSNHLIKNFTLSLETLIIKKVLFLTMLNLAVTLAELILRNLLFQFQKLNIEPEKLQFLMEEKFVNNLKQT